MDYIELWENVTPLFEDDITNEENKNTSTITPYLIEDGKKHSCVIVFPGGGYKMRADHEGEPIARFLNSIGIHAFVLNYRVQPYKHPAMILDALRSIKHVRFFSEKYMVNKIGVLGFSAGGHLAASCVTLFNNDFYEPNYKKDEIDAISSRPDCGILCYPVISLTEEFGHVGSGENLVGENEKLKQELSSHNNVQLNTPPVFMWHTSDDDCVNVLNSLKFGEKLREKNINFELHVFPSGDHGLGLASEKEDISQWASLCSVWLKGIAFKS